MAHTTVDLHRKQKAITVWSCDRYQWSGGHTFHKPPPSSSLSGSERGDPLTCYVSLPAASGRLSGRQRMSKTERKAKVKRANEGNCGVALSSAVLLLRFPSLSVWLLQKRLEALRGEGGKYQRVKVWKVHMETLKLGMSQSKPDFFFPPDPITIFPNPIFLKCIKKKNMRKKHILIYS